MRRYEGLFIFDAALSPKAIEDSLKKVEDVLKKGKAKVERKDE